MFKMFITILVLFVALLSFANPTDHGANADISKISISSGDQHSSTGMNCDSPDPCGDDCHGSFCCALVNQSIENLAYEKSRVKKPIEIFLGSYMARVFRPPAAS